MEPDELNIEAVKASIGRLEPGEHVQDEILRHFDVASREQNQKSKERTLRQLGFPSADDLLRDAEKGSKDFAAFLTSGEATKERNVEEPAFKSEKPTKAELEALKDVAKPEQIEKVKGEINKLGRDPREVILDAAKDKNNRVIGLGEWHVTPNGLRTLTESMMGDFKSQGITHLAVEIHEDDQKLLDRFAAGSKEAGEELKKSYGGIHDDSLKMMAEAAKNGIKLVAVDGAFDRHKKSEVDHEALDDKETQRRDDRMAKNIKGILDGDSKARVLFVVGAAHLEEGSKKNTPAAARLKEDGIGIKTFGSHMEVESNYFTTPALVKDMTKAVAVETAKTEHLKNFPASTEKDSPPVGRHDVALFFPADSSLKILEKTHGKDSAKLLPDLEAVTKTALQSGESPRSNALLERTVNIAKKEFGAQSKEVADLYERLARHSKGEQTAKLHFQSMEIREKLDGGKPSKEYARSAGYVVQMHMEDGKIKESVKVFDRAAEKLLGTSGQAAQVKDFLQASEYLVRRAEKTESKDTVAAILQKRVALMEKNEFPAGSAFDDKLKLGQIYSQQGKKELAEKTLRGAVTDAGADADKLFSSRRELAKFLIKTEQPAEAEKLLKANYDEALKDPSTKFPAFTEFAKQLEAAGKTAEAAKVYKSGMEQWEKGLTESRSSNAAIDREFLSSYGSFLKKEGLDAEAQKIDEKVKFLNLAERAVRSLNQGQKDEAVLKTFQDAMKLWEKGATNKPGGNAFLSAYARLLDRLDKEEEAKVIRSKIR